jgi:multidrug efflux pump subunit AcrA (membrane-fusion protein)
MNKKTLLLALLGISSLALSGCTKEENNKIMIPEDEIMTIKSEKFSPKLNLIGVVEAGKEINLASKISGRIEKILINVGDFVRENEVLVNFSANDNQAQIFYNNAVSDLATTKNSLESSISRAEINVKNVKNSHQKNKEKEKIIIKELDEALRSQVKVSHISVEKILNFLDTTIGASEKSNEVNNTSVIRDIGKNNQNKKQQIKNNAKELVQKISQEMPPYFPDALEDAKKEYEILEKIELLANDFYNLAKNTNTTRQFNEQKKQEIKNTTERYLKEIGIEKLTIKTQIRKRESTKERLELDLIGTENMIKNAEAQLRNVQSGAKQEVRKVKNAIITAGNKQQELVLKAPFSGIITQKFFEEGALIGAGNPILHLADKTALKIKTEIPDIYNEKIKQGMSVEIAIDGFDEKIPGKISRINPIVSLQTRTLGIEIIFNEKSAKIKLGMIAKISIKLD